MAQTQRISGTELQRFSRVSAVRGAFDVLAPWCVIAASAWAATRSEVWYGYALALIVIASRQAALANLAHDAWHRLCLPSRAWNDFIGAWFYSYPVGVPYFHDRRRHLKHHRLVGRSEDPDWVNYSNTGRETPGRVLLFLAGRLTGSLLWSTVWSVVWNRKPRISLDDEPANPREPRHEMLRVALCQLILVATFGLAFRWWSYAVFWLLPLATLTAFCNNLRALVEHVAADPEAEPAARLRDIAAGPIERTFLSPAHFHFHALHHAHPTIPHYRLSRAKQQLITIAGSYPYAVMPGYIRGLLAHLTTLAKHPPERS